MENSKKLGYDELVDSLADMMGVAENLKKAASDGIQYTDIFAVSGLFPVFQELRKDYKQAVNEFLDLDVAESRAVALQVAQRTGQPADGMLARINESFVLLSNTYGAYKAVENVVQDWIRFGKSFQKPEA